MLKLKLLMPLAFITMSLFANDYTEKQLEICEDTYVLCSAKCEESENEDLSKCISECEKSYYKCESSIPNQYIETTNER